MTHNSSMFLNLNISTGKLFSSNSIGKLNGIFGLFSGISPNFSLYGKFLSTTFLFVYQIVYLFLLLLLLNKDIPNLFGRTLCGPEFSFRLEDYGYRIVPTALPPDATMPPNTNFTSPTTTTSTPSPAVVGRMDKSQSSSTSLPPTGSPPQTINSISNLIIIILILKIIIA